MIHALLLILSLQGAPAVAQRDADTVADQLAARDSYLERRLVGVVIDDPAMRAEIRRTGLARGCRVLYASRSEVAASYRSTIVPITAAAIRKIVPAERLASARVLSFVTGPLIAYRLRVQDEVERNAADTLVAADGQMRRVFLERIRAEPAGSPGDARLMPRSDIAAVLGLTGPYDLDNPAQLGLACAEGAVAPEDRPTITTGPPR